jgi:hypothetical protein
MRAVVPSLVLLLACRPGAGVVERITADSETFADELTLAYCTRQQACHPNTWLVAFGVEGCQEEMESFGAVDEVGYDPRDAAFCSVDALAAQQCLDAIDVHVCDSDASLVPLPDACDAAFFDCDLPVPPVF